MNGARILKRSRENVQFRHFVCRLGEGRADFKFLSSFTLLGS
jgi:hypothetical protein